MERIAKICSYLDRCESFADVGCDHGYCARYALKNGLCDKAYITDVSAKSLQKARSLLADEIACGKCAPVCCDGLIGVPEDCEQVLIAGMGGEEILKILKQSFIPRKFVFQPMKNAPELRTYLLENGCKLTADDVFYDRKYYFIVKGERAGGTAPYTERERAFGRDSLRNPVLKGYAAEEAEKRRRYLSDCPSGQAREKLLRELEVFTEIQSDDR